jgi:CHAT domain-containing protein
LSACSTGLPRQHPANEFIGLPTAFLIAGAKNVVGSLWPVDDAATCLLMREFYSALVQNGELVSTPSTSLAFARDRLTKLRRTEIVEILGKDSDIIPELEYPYAGPEYTLAFQHYGVD